MAVSIWQVLSTSYKLSVVYATSAGDSLLGDVHRWRLRRLDKCPTDEFLPDTPVGYVVNAYGMPGTNDAKVLELLEVLLEKGCDIDARSREGTVPLHVAIMSGEAELVEFLLNNGADSKLKYEWKAVAGFSYRKSKFEGLNALELAEALQEIDSRNNDVVKVLKSHSEDK